MNAYKDKQPAAAHDPICYRWRHSEKEHWQYSDSPRGWEYQPLYAAPVAAVPTDGTVLTNPYTGQPRDYRDVESDPQGILIVNPGEPLFADNSTKKAWWAGYRAGKGLPPDTPRSVAASTTAAPGIDLEPFRRLVEWNYDSEFSAYENGFRTEEQREVAEAERKRLLALIDASPKGGSEAPAVENVAEDTYHAIAEVLRTEGGWSVLEHVEYCRELIWEARVALGMDGANADTNHRHRGLWVKLGRCLEGFAPGSDEALSELSKCDCQNPCPETGAALVSMACPIHNDLPAAQASDAEVQP